MAIINKGKSFANGEQLTADKLNQVIDNSSFTMYVNPRAGVLGNFWQAIGY